MNKLDEILFEHGIYPNFKGYQYIRDIIAIKKPISTVNITKLYQEKSEKFGTTSGGVERAIRNAITKSDFGRISNKKALAVLQVEYKGDDYSEI